MYEGLRLFADERTKNDFFFFNDTATTEIYTLSLHDALPICRCARATSSRVRRVLPIPAGPSIKSTLPCLAGNRSRQLSMTRHSASRFTKRSEERRVGK